MKYSISDWIAVIGQANAGKTYWISHHIEKIPDSKLYIYDFNNNDYQDFKKAQLWNVQEGSQEEIEKFMKIVYTRGNAFTVLEEADNYLLFPSNFIRRFVNTARNRNIGAMVSCKRAKSIQPVYRNRFSHLIVFRTTVPEDIEYMEKWAGVPRGNFDCIRTLEQGEFIHCNLVNGDIAEVNKL